MYFQNNKIGAIPAILAKCKSLKVLNFENNAFRVRRLTRRKLAKFFLESLLTAQDPNFDLKRKLEELVAYLNELLVSEPQPKLADIPNVTKTGAVEHDHTNEVR